MISLPCALLALCAYPTLEPAQEPTCVAYGVADLTGWRAVGQPPLGDLPDGVALAIQGQTEWLAAVAQQKERSADAAGRVEALRRAVATYCPGTPDAAHLVVVHPGVLTLVGTPEQHGWVGRFLETQRAEERWVLVHAQLLRTTPGVTERLGLMAGKVLSTESERDALVARVLQEKGDRLVAPRVLTRPGSTASMFVGEELPYIADYEVRFDPASVTETAEPVVRTVQEGVQLETRVTRLPDSLAAEVELTLSEITRPIPERVRVVSSGRAEVRVQDPEVRRVRLQTDLSLRDGETAVLASPDVDGEQDLVFLITFSLVEPARDER